MSKKIATILETIIPEECLWKITLLQAWPEIIGKLADKISIFSIEKDLLILQASHAVWAQELNFLAPLILKKINTLLKRDLIKNISFKIIKRHPIKNQTDSKSINTLHSRTNPSYPISTRESSKLNTIKDEQLKKVLSDYLLRTKTRV